MKEAKTWGSYWGSEEYKELGDSRRWRFIVPPSPSRPQIAAMDFLKKLSLEDDKKQAHQTPSAPPPSMLLPPAIVAESDLTSDPQLPFPRRRTTSSTNSATASTSSRAKRRLPHLRRHLQLQLRRNTSSPSSATFSRARSQSRRPLLLLRLLPRRRISSTRLATRSTSSRAKNRLHPLPSQSKRISLIRSAVRLARSRPLPRLSPRRPISWASWQIRSRAMTSPRQSRRHWAISSTMRSEVVRRVKRKKASWTKVRSTCPI